MGSRTALALNGVFGIKVTIAFASYALMARTFGTSAEMDTFWVAVTPTLVGINLIEACGIGAALTYYEGLRQEPDALRRSQRFGLLVICPPIRTALGLAGFP